MTKSTTVTSKAFVAIVAAAMVFSLVAPAAKAATTEELQAQITALMAQIAALNTGAVIGTGADKVTSAYTFTRALTVGSTGADVTALQNYLLSKGYVISSATGYFGPQTKAAVAAWQTANGVAPAAGYFGPVSQAKYMALMAAITPAEPTTPGTTTPTATLKGSADLKSVDVEDGDDTDVQEGAEDAQVALATVEFQNGDASISRLDIKLAGPTSRPYDVFDSFSLWVDGKMVAEADASSKSDFIGTGKDVIRFSGLDIVAMEDESVEITIGATIKSSVKAASLGDWTITVDSLRFFDADDVATTDNSTATGDATVNVDVAGANDKVTIKKASADPKETTLKVETNTTKTTEDIGVFMISVDDQSSDVVVNDGKITLKVTNPATASTTIDTADVIDKVVVTLDGKKVTGKYSSGANAALGIGATATIVYTLDFNEYDLSAGDDYDATVSVTFKGQNTNKYGNGVSVLATTAGADWDIDGVDPITTTGTYTGKAQTLNSADVTFSSYAWTVPAVGNLIDFTFTVSAQDEDFNVMTASIATTTSGSATTAAGVLSVNSGDATAIAGGFKVEAGDTATFRVRFNVTGANGTTAEVKLTAVAGQTVPTDKQTSPTATRNVAS